jgi:MFS family permease
LQNTAEIQKSAQRITRTLFVTQSLGSAGLIAMATVNSIAGASLSGRAELAGLPSAVYLAGSAFSAWLWGLLMERYGRRFGLLAGVLVGSLGAAIAGYALIRSSFTIFLIGLLLLGSAQAAVQLGRFVSAEVHPPLQRGQAISNVVLGGTAGSVFGPLLAGPAGAWMNQAGLNELAGPYAAALGLFLLAALVVFIYLRPEPRQIAAEVNRLYSLADHDTQTARSSQEILRSPGPLTAIIIMVFAQLVMVMLMVITGLHMKGHQHVLTDISLVISSHTFGMYAFSLISGRLADNWGRAPVILIGAITLVLACALAPLSPEVLPLAVSLFLLGLGWNFCFIGGSSLLADQLTPGERSRIQGINDLLIGLASALGSLGSGVIFAVLGYGTTGVLGAVTATIPVLAILAWRQWQRQAKPA